MRHQPLRQGFPPAIGIGLFSIRLARAAGKGREQAKIDVHRLKTVGICALGNVVRKRAKGGFERWDSGLLAVELLYPEPGCEQANGRTLDIAFAARDLPCKADARPGFHP